MREPMMSWEICSQTWIRASQSSITALDVPIYNVPEGLNWIQMSFWRALAVLFLFLLAQIKLIPILMLGCCRSTARFSFASLFKFGPWPQLSIKHVLNNCISCSSPIHVQWPAIFDKFDFLQFCTK